MSTHLPVAVNHRLLRRVASLVPANRADRIIWSVVGLTFLASLLAVGWSGFRIRPTPLLGQILLAALAFGAIAWCLRRKANVERLRALSIAACQLFLLLVFTKPLHFVLMATALPAVDAELAAADRALGLDWPAYADFLQRTAWLDGIVEQLYVQNFVHTVGVLILVANLCPVGRLREMAGVAVLASLATVLIAWMVPALGAHSFYGHPDTASVAYLGDLLALRSGEMRVVDFSDITGVAACPSFHTVMALIFICGALGHRGLALVVIAAELGLLLAIPVYGSHHFVDMLCGAALFLVTLWLWRRTVGPPDRPPGAAA